jgi:hypothetical protein
LILSIRMGQWPCCLLLCQGRVPVCSLWSVATRLPYNYHTYKTPNQWCSVVTQFQDGTGSILWLYLTRQATNTSLTNVCNQLPCWLRKIHSNKWSMFNSRSFSEWGSDHIVHCFTKEGCQHVCYGKQRPGHVSITIHTRLKIVDAVLKLIFRMGQWPCCSLFCQRRLPVRLLWKAAARSLFN